MLTKMLPIIAILFLPLFLSLSSATIIVGIDENYPPHEFVEDASVRGFNVDIMKAIAKEINETVEFKPMKWHDAVEALKNGSVDALFMAKHKERLKYFDFSQPILDLKLAIFVKNVVYGIATIYDLAGHSVAVEKDDVSAMILKQEVPEAIIIEVNNQSMAIDLVENGDAKAFFGNYHTGVYLIGKKGYKDLKVIGEEIDIGERCIAVKKGNVILLNKINEGIKKIKDSGEYDAIYKKWFGEGLYEKYFPKWIFYLFLGIILSIGGGAGALSLWNYTLKKKLDKSTEEIVSYKNYLESILENAPIAILKIDGDFKVVYENPAMKKMMGANEKGIVGKDIRELDSVKKFIKDYGMEDVFDRLLKGEMVSGEGWFTSIFGKTSYMYFKAVPLINGGFKGAIFIADDWTEKEKYERKLKAIAEVSTALVGEMDLDEIFEKSLMEIVKALGADGGVIFEVEDNQLILRKAYGMSKEYIKKYKKLELGKYLVGKVAMSGKSILIKNSLKDKRCTKEEIESEKYLSAIVVPIKYEGKVMGCMALVSRKAHYFSMRDLNILQSIANHVASAIKAAKWHQRVIKALEKEREFKLRAAHYFFNPICIAKGFLELAKEEKDGKNKIDKAIKAIERIEKVVENITQKGEIKE